MRQPPYNWPRKLGNPSVRVTLVVSRAAARKTLLLQRAAITASGVPKLRLLAVSNVASISAARPSCSRALPLPVKPCAGGPTANDCRSRRRRRRRERAGSICRASFPSTSSSRWAGSRPCASEYQARAGSPPAIQLTSNAREPRAACHHSTNYQKPNGTPQRARGTWSSHLHRI